MLKKIKRSMEKIPYPAYIFLKCTIILCDILLFTSAVLFQGTESVIGYSERMMMANLMLETPAGLLFLALIGFSIIIDNC